MLRWILLLASLVYLVDSMVLAQEVPMVNDDPLVRDTMDADVFDFVSKILSGGKMSPHMLCTLKVRNTRELRNFSRGKQWVEFLEISFNSNGFDSGLKMNFKLPDNAKYGIKKSPNQWSGLGEDIKIELGDYYGHWIKFSHDGQDRLVQLILGNNLRITPCQIK